MVRHGLTVGLFGLWMCAGCAGTDSPTTLVPAGPFHRSPAAPAQVRTSFAPATTEAAAQVDTLGRKIIAANKQAGVKPLFRTIGAPQPEVFHVGTTEIDITEGLVKQCKTEADLAAVLCNELGKMVSEREAAAGTKTRLPEREPPQDVRIGTDSGADLTRLAELGKFEKEFPRTHQPPLPPPDPQLLARNYLVKAGYAEKDLETAATIIQAAASNSTFEKQIGPTGTSRSWTRN